MGESIYIKQQEEDAAANAAQQAQQSVLLPTRNGMTLRGIIDQNNVAPASAGQQPPPDLAIFGAGKVPGSQLFDHARGTMRTVLDKVNALNVVPEGTPQGDAARKVVAGQTAQEIMDKGGDGPRFEKTDGQLYAPREEKTTWEVDPQNSDITDVPGMPRYHDTMRQVGPEEAKDMKRWRTLALAGATAATMKNPVTLPVSPLLGMAGTVMSEYGEDWYNGSYVVDRPDPQRDKDAEGMSKPD